MNEDDVEGLVESVVSGDQRALARAITVIEDRRQGYRELVRMLHRRSAGAEVVGVTGAPGSGKSTLVDEAVSLYLERGLSVGVVAVDPSSPYSGGAVLGDRIRLTSNSGDPDVFFRSMSARGSLGGLSTAASDAVRALDAYGVDVVLLETVGAGQNEVDIVRTADTVAVLVQPGSGDAIQTLKAGILEIADVFVVNKADLTGADRAVKDLEELVGRMTKSRGHHGPPADGGSSCSGTVDEDGWAPPVVETVAKSGEGVEGFIDAVERHLDWLRNSGEGRLEKLSRYEAELTNLLRQEIAEDVERFLDEDNLLSRQAERMAAGETDPYTAVDDMLDSWSSTR